MKKLSFLLTLVFIWTCSSGGGGSPTEPKETAPVANFTANPTAVTQGQAVTFTSTSTGTITSFSWNVDADPTPEATTASFTHTYEDVGTYGVTLTVTGPGGSNTKSSPNLITVSSAAPTPTTVTNQSVQEDGTTSITLTATDPNGQTVTFAITTEPTNGTASLSGSTLTYTPDTNFYGTDTVAYTASNGTYTSDPVTITITVGAVDDGDPTTNDISATTDEDTPVTLTLDATEIDGDSYSFAISTQPSNGTLGTINNDLVTYTPNENWNGEDTFTFEATDDRTFNRRNIATATITVNAVNDPPVANDVTASTNSRMNFSESVELTLTASDVEGDELTYSIVSDVSNGTTFLSGNVVTYTPNANFDGTDTFTFKANDGQDDSNIASGSITVTDINPNISIEASPTSGTKNLRVKFTNNSSNYSSASWEFGDGNTSTDISPVHLYTSAGIYDVTVTLQSDLGTTIKTFEDYIEVKEISLPAISLDPKYLSASAGDNVSFAVKLLGVENLSSVQVILAYNSDELTLGSITAGDFLKGDSDPMFITETIESQSSSIDQIKIFTSTLSSDKQSVSGDGIIATLNFTIASSLDSDILSTISFKEIASQIMLDIDGNQIEVNDLINGYIINE